MEKLYLGDVNMFKKDDRIVITSTTCTGESKLHAVVICNDSVTVGDVEMVTMSIDMIHEYVVFIRKCNEGKHEFHRLDGPAITHAGSDEFFYFFVYGINYAIEDMPIDEEMKVILKLKYSKQENAVNGWLVYK